MAIDWLLGAGCCLAIVWLHSAGCCVCLLTSYRVQDVVSGY